MTTSVWWGFINGLVSDLPTDKEACQSGFCRTMQKMQVFH